MKKLLLPLLALLLFSCSTEEKPSNKIVGSWQYQGITEFTQDGEAIERAPATCTENSTLSFSNNGNLKSVDYTIDSNWDCIINELATSDELQWEEISDGTYKIFSARGGTEYEISFPDNSTMWMISGGSYTRDGVSYKHKASVYTKIWNQVF